MVSRWAGRSALGIAVVALACALMAPVANATPESDAADAITAAWTAAGGDTSALGGPDGDVYAVGAGFAQNFAGGAIFFTPDTGAKTMFGAILDKYRAVGGPADSDLGFPNIDEGPGKVSPDSRNSTFSAADHPVIFWTPDTGAWVVRGALNAAWDRLGGSAGVLGVPIADESYDGDVVSQKFSGGQLSFDTRTQSFTTEPSDLAGQLGGLTIPGDATTAINAAYRAAGGAAGPLGARQGDQFTIGADGLGQAFAGGKIFYSPATGAHVVAGAILEKYEAAGGPTGDLGLPNSAEADGGVPGSRVSSFAAADNPVIFATADHGAVIVRGAMKAAWDKLGGATGALGVPESDQSVNGDTTTQKFSGGKLSWDAKKNAFTTDPANLAESLGGLQVPAQQPGATPAAPAPAKDNALRWHSWWLWWIIPLALLLLASLGAVLYGRRRRASGTDFADDFADDFDDDVDEAPRWSAPSAPETGEPAYPAANWREPGAPVVLQPRWSGPAASDDTPEEHELFTHHGAEESSDDQDAVDTAPTRVQGGGVITYSGRHAAVEPDEPDEEDEPARPERFGWRRADDDPYPPTQGSLFAPVFGAAPPPSQPRADIMEPDIYHEESDESDDEPDQDDEPDREPDHKRDERPDDDDRQDRKGDEGPDHDEQSDRDERRDRDSGPASKEDAEPQGRHADLPAIHLPLDDPDEAPEGYPVKGSMSTGKYHTPDSDRYDEVVAQIWFIDAEHAEANGFTRAD